MQKISDIKQYFNNLEFRKECCNTLSKIEEELNKNNLINNRKKINNLNYKETQFFYTSEIDDGYNHIGIKIDIFNPYINNDEDQSYTFLEESLIFYINPFTKHFEQKYRNGYTYKTINGIVDSILYNLNEFKFNYIFNNLKQFFKELDIEHTYTLYNLYQDDDLNEIYTNLIKYKTNNYNLLYEFNENNGYYFIDKTSKTKNLLECNIYNKNNLLFTITIDYINNLYVMNNISSINLETVIFTPYNSFNDIKKLIKEYINKTTYK